MEKEKDKNYIISTSIDNSYNEDEFVIELFSCPENAKENSTLEKVIHNFDELITFFEGLDEEKTSQL
jgi:hypothetical protein